MSEVEIFLYEQLQQKKLAQYFESFKIYLNCLISWNKAFNLTAIRNPQEIVSRHFIESLEINQFIKGYNILDVGSGPGFPGMPLAIINPEKKFYLLDSNIKKINFLNEIKRQLNINNVNIIYSRITDFHPKIYFDTVMSRALCSLSEFINWTNHLIEPKFGIWLNMKGKYPSLELQEVSKIVPTINFKVIENLQNNKQVERCIVLMQRANNCG